eukprot:XP_016881537.1 transmembrane protein 241 isoform X6 [Homo sapiens]
MVRRSESRAQRAEPALLFVGHWEEKQARQLPEQSPGASCFVVSPVLQVVAGGRFHLLGKGHLAAGALLFWAVATVSPESPGWRGFLTDLQLGAKVKKIITAGLSILLFDAILTSATTGWREFCHPQPGAKCLLSMHTKACSHQGTPNGAGLELSATRDGPGPLHGGLWRYKLGHPPSEERVPQPELVTLWTLAAQP